MGCHTVVARDIIYGQFTNPYTTEALIRHSLSLAGQSVGHPTTHSMETPVYSPTAMYSPDSAGNPTAPTTIRAVRDAHDEERAVQHRPDNHREFGETLTLLSATLSPERRIIHCGDTVFRVGERFISLYVLNSGACKIINLTNDGREQLVGLRFRGDWIGFDGIAAGTHGCDARAVDIGELWEFPYEALIAAAVKTPRLMVLMHRAMSMEIARDHESLMTVCTLPADARVAHFLHQWSERIAERGLRSDQITLSVSRAEIGSHLGMTLESVSRALSRLAKAKLIRFSDRDRRAISIPAMEELGQFIEDKIASPVLAT
jgi:CRP/FNR family transcriptional regulator, anaerobic regulatory protein